MTPHKLWTFVGIVGAFAGIVDVARQHRTRKDELNMPPEQNTEQPLDPGSIRDRIVAWAESQEGESDPSPYWQQVLGRPNGPKSWCGAFAMTALQKQGLATGLQWATGKGLEKSLPKLTKTTTPQRGDIAYYKTNQHMAVVADVHGETVRLVNGNGAAGRVTINERPLSDAVAYYNIQPYIDETEGVA